jgi:predicted CoA-substrate-specific enzyme activase
VSDEVEMTAGEAKTVSKPGTAKAKTFYVCKYTPVELLEAMGADCEILNGMLPGFDISEQVAGPNICGFGKTVLEAVLEGDVRELVLVDCCDVIRCVYDILVDSGKLDFIYMLDMLHCDGQCARDSLAAELHGLAKAYGEYRGTEFDVEKFKASFKKHEMVPGPHVSVMGARMGDELYDLVKEAMPLPVQNDTCVNNRDLGGELPPDTSDIDDLLRWYAGRIFEQIPCMRMADTSGRRRLLEDPNLKGIIYHTVKFCDFYTFEYEQIKQREDIPLLKIESDYTTQSTGQLLTRLEAFRESLEATYPEELGAASTLEAADKKKERHHMGKGLFVGIDSGSTSTDVVVMDRNHRIVAQTIIPTGAGASISAEAALDEILLDATFSRDDIDATVTTGYGRSSIEIGDKSITEISCHARGAHFLDPRVRTVIDIGGQDSKVIKLDEDGNVVNFAMNDKCAAGTGRFLETMAHTLQIDLDELSQHGLQHDENITISNTCTVFAESEVVGLIAQNKSVDDIVYGLDKAVASRTFALVRRVNGEGIYMMTGGVSKNAGVVKALEEKLGEPLVVDLRAQLCGAIGAALFASEIAG